MSLDQNLFTLNVSPRADDRNVLDLVDTDGVAHYTKRRLPATEYTIEMLDPLSESVLATVTAPSPTSKHKTLQLYNPDSVVELKYTGTIHFKWSFKWEEHEFEWRREECYILRKPDPAVLVAITKEPPGRLQTRSIQILDYNLNRFDIEDRKGLEIVILTALLTFQDMNETYHTPSPSTPTETAATLAPGTSPGLAGRLGLSRQPSQILSNAPPAIPPKPAPRVGVERVAEMHAVRAAQGEGDANEIEVSEECAADDYAAYAERLLEDEAMLFITVRSATAAEVPKVLRVVEETKRLRHKSGVAEDEELHQYVVYDTHTAGRKGPRRINLNDPDPKGKGKDADKYAPPTNLTVHLSKIDMPELQPKASPANVRRPSGSGGEYAEMSDKERRKAEKESKKAAKEAKKAGKQRDTAPIPSTQPTPHKLTKPTNSVAGSTVLVPERPRYSSFFERHVPAHQIHPNQPSPSPSQLKNPVIYAAPPPMPPNRPKAETTLYPPNPTPMAFPSPGYAPEPVPSFYGSAVGSGYNATPPPQAGYRPGYASRPPQQRPASYHPPSTASKGPVTALLEMWSKH